MLGVLVVGAGVGLWASFQRDPDPVFKGTSLSGHLATLKIEGVGVFWNIVSPVSVQVDFKEPPDPVVEEAIRQTGTNGLVLIGKMLGAKPPRGAIMLWRQGTKLAERFPSLRRPVNDLDPFDRARTEQLRAVYALQHLGSNALPLVPQIVPLLRDPLCANSVEMALLAIWPLRVEDMVKHTNHVEIRCPPAFLPLYSSLEEADGGAASTPARSRPQFGRVLPQVLSLLWTTNRWVGTTAGPSGTEARDVIPSLFEEPNWQLPSDLDYLGRSAEAVLDPSKPLPVHPYVEGHRSWTVKAVPWQEHAAAGEDPTQTPASNAPVKVRKGPAERQPFGN